LESFGNLKNVTHFAQHNSNSICCHESLDEKIFEVLIERPDVILFAHPDLEKGIYRAVPITKTGKRMPAKANHVYLPRKPNAGFSYWSNGRNYGK